MNSILRFVRLALFALTTLLLVGTGAFLVLQRNWDRPEMLDNETAFRRGSIGTEIMPLPVFVALPELFPELFQPQGVQAGQWYEQFGMNDHLSDENNLPTGFFVSNKRPKSAAPSPVKFVGIACVMCHSTEIRKPGGDVELVIGPGNSSLNLFAWIDAFQTAVMDEERLTMDSIKEIYTRETGEKISLSERIMISAWLNQTREKVSEGTSKYGVPFHGDAVLDPRNVPTGPGRTQPFRTLVRRLLDQPGTDMHVFTKISAVFQQDHREWAQVDGSIRDLHGRSSVAAYAAGATVQNMKHPDIVHNITAASNHTRNLDAADFGDVFPEHAADKNSELFVKGRAVYAKHCVRCHGKPNSAGGWDKGLEQGKVVSHELIGTDPERVTFRAFDELPDKVVEEFSKGHPFAIKREDIRPGPAGTTKGYINAPIENAWTRAPYLHNASVLTLAELINLEPRRTTFYRGRNEYDPVRVGLSTPESATQRAYFRFDASVRGNSNQGHDYPWSYDSPDRDEESLIALMEYLKTL